jgi:hypothetical protein
MSCFDNNLDPQTGTTYGRRRHVARDSLPVDAGTSKKRKRGQRSKNKIPDTKHAITEVGEARIPIVTPGSQGNIEPSIPCMCQGTSTYTEQNSVIPQHNVHHRFITKTNVLTQS